MLEDPFPWRSREELEKGNKRGRSSPPILLRSSIRQRGVGKNNSKSKNTLSSVVFKMFTTRDMSVPDVYDVATDIGNDFERLIDLHGLENIEGLMQKVITVLEHLETAASARADENNTIESLQSTIKHFELNEIKKNEERLLQCKELEEIEEHYKQETQDLLATVKRLQDEKRKLQSSLTQATERDSAFSEDSYFEVELVNRLQSVIEKQRHEIKTLDQTMLDLKTENEEFKIQIEKSNSCLKEARRKNRSSQIQMHLLLDERAELTAKVHDQSREMMHLLRQLGQATAECEDLSQAAASGTDNDDPHRPRFSLQELRDILQERNSLKAKISDLEDELSLFRPKKNADSELSSLDQRFNSSLNGDDCMEAIFLEYDATKEDDEDDSGKNEEDLEADDLDLPVQGPLPQDPEDAPWRKKESGIRKLFHRVFGKDPRPFSELLSCEPPRPIPRQNPSSSSSIDNFGRSLSRYSVR